MKSSSEDLSDLDWNFDELPDNELIACCYWEYARESAFIRKTLLQYREWIQDGASWSDPQSDSCKGIERIQSIGYAAEVFIRGCAFPTTRSYQSVNPAQPNYRHPQAPVITGSFPSPWLALSPEERKERRRIRSHRKEFPLAPFKRGGWHDAQDIAKWAENRWLTLHSAYESVRRANPEVSEVELVRQGKLQEFPGIQPSLYWEGGGEVTVVSIQWSDFTNEELIEAFRKWVKTNRPKQLGNPDARGHKPGDWRANLTRLAVMRLLARCTALQLVDPRQNKLPAVWETKLFSRPKWRDVTKWHDARREAGALFRKLFPFLPPEEKPLSWHRTPAGK